MTTPQQFIDDIRANPKFVEGSKRDPAFHCHLKAMERGIEAIRAQGNDDVVWLERFDELQAIIARDDLTVKERLLELVKVLTPWHRELTARPGH
jgi:hypothetical protein